MSKQFSDLGVSKANTKSDYRNGNCNPNRNSAKNNSVIVIKHTDIVGFAKTGTGKTAAFGLPLLQLIDTNVAAVQAVILVPTRELGQQIFNNLEEFCQISS